MVKQYSGISIGSDAREIMMLNNITAIHEPNFDPVDKEYVPAIELSDFLRKQDGILF
jgi:hypothetical protein